ncbi:MAG: DUF61 family protein [Thermoplasmata archaeon]|nr:DUF61 family protein [Thermoplasmata archaeon]
MADFLASVMSELNSNLAVGKRTLEQMMDSGDFTYKTRSGSVVSIPKEQMDYLWEVCEETEKIRLRLPIYVSTDISSDIGAWKVEGTPDADVVARILGKNMHREGYLRLYHPDMRDLKSKIPDAIIVVFTP